MWRHRSVSLNNEKICCEISEDKIAFCEKTAGLRRGKFSDSNSACLKVSVSVKIFQFQDMLNESERYQDAANGLLIEALVINKLLYRSSVWANIEKSKEIANSSELRMPNHHEY